MKNGQKLLGMVREYYRKEYSGVQDVDKKPKLAEDIISRDRAKEQLAQIERKFKVKGKTLEVGSGFGTFLALLTERGIDAHGTEPEDIAMKATLMQNKKCRVVKGVGEKLPFGDGIFDFVFSFQVLEHTQNPEKVLDESLRVLKREGILYFVIPNYNSFWEGHYGIFWLPRFPRPLAKFYLKLKGKDPKFLDSIQYITPQRLEKHLKEKDVEILSMGKEEWKERITKTRLSGWSHTGKATGKLMFLRKAGLAGIVASISNTFNWHYPIVLVLRKK